MMRRMGWLRDLPDYRDFTDGHDDLTLKLKTFGQKDSIKMMMDKIKTSKASATPSSAVDLRSFCSPIEDQGNLGSCTAHAGVGLVEYFEKRAFGKYIDASRLFLYKVTRNLLHETGDTGAYLRTTAAALTLFGVPPEEYWIYDTTKFDVEPTAFLYSYASSYQAITYYRLDPPGTSFQQVLANVKGKLAAGLPSMFGFTVYSSYTQADATGKIPFPTRGDKIEGGHAVAAIGYDDKMKIKNANTGGIETTGALLIRNSWGTGWGDRGYGWLPYEYVLRGLAVDWWSLLKNEWINTGQFGLP